MHANKWDKEGQNILPGRKILEYFVVNEFDEELDANRTDMSPHNKVWHKTLSIGNRRVVVNWIGIGIKKEPNILMI